MVLPATLYLAAAPPPLETLSPATVSKILHMRYVTTWTCSHEAPLLLLSPYALTADHVDACSLNMYSSTIHVQYFQHVCLSPSSQAKHSKEVAVCPYMDMFTNGYQGHLAALLYVQERTLSSPRTVQHCYMRYRSITSFAFAAVQPP